MPRLVVRDGDVVTVAATIVVADSDQATMTLQFWDEEACQTVFVTVGLDGLIEVIAHDRDYDSDKEGE